MLIGASGFLIFVGLQFKRTVTDTRDTLASHREEWATTLKELRVTLETHRTEISHAIASINGQELSQAVGLFEKLVQEQRSSAQRIERAAVAIGTFTREWLSDRSFGEPETTGIDTTGHATAAPGERFISSSRTAREDAAALQEESEDNSQANEP